jgi:GntR family transcriptional repressor for pyruvate dehydrogenase complex
MVALPKIKTAPLRSQVYTQLKDRLLAGDWKPGDKFPSEMDLCRSFGVSRVTIRAAIQQLEILGLVEIRQGGGTIVREVSAVSTINKLHPLLKVRKGQDLLAIMEYRKIIEKGTVGLACEKITAADIDFLEETLRTMKENRNYETYSRADYSFHYRLAQIAANPIIIKIYDLVNDILSNAMSEIVHLTGFTKGVFYHRKIINALKNRNKPLCESLMEAHIQGNIRAILAGTSKIRP